MCLIIFNWQPESKEPLLLLGNRDEFYQRPSKVAHRWADKPHIIAGRDLRAGGTWLGISSDLRLCTVTNYREIPVKEGNRSRGEIPTDFLDSNLSAEAFAQKLASQQALYAGFNALIFDGEQLVYSSNRSHTPIKVLEPGLYGVSNHLLDSPWPKLERAKRLTRAILSDENLLHDARNQALLDAMMDQEKPEDNHLPDTGIGIEGERLLSSIFIESEHYGTRTTSLVHFKEGALTLTERNYITGMQNQKATYSEQSLNPI